LEMTLTEMQKGILTKNVICVELTAASGGQLVCFRPLTDDVDVDIVVYHRHTKRTLFIATRGRYATVKRSTNTVHFQIRRDAFEPHKDLYLLCVFFEERAAAPKPLVYWLVPSLEFVEKAGNGKDYVMRPSISPKSRTKWDEYRFFTPHELVKKLNMILRGVNGG